MEGKSKLLAVNSKKKRTFALSVRIEFKEQK